MGSLHASSSISYKPKALSKLFQSSNGYSAESMRWCIFGDIPKHIKAIKAINLLFIRLRFTQCTNGDEYDVWAIKVINVLKLQDLWHFIVEEDLIDPKKFNALKEFEKERRQVVALCLIQDSIDYSLFHYIVEADSPKRAWDTLKEVFSEEPTIEENDFSS